MFIVREFLRTGYFNHTAKADSCDLQKYSDRMKLFSSCPICKFIYRTLLSSGFAIQNAIISALRMKLAD